MSARVHVRGVRALVNGVVCGVRRRRLRWSGRRRPWGRHLATREGGRQGVQLGESPASLSWAQGALGEVSLGEDAVQLLRDVRVMLREDCELLVSDRRLTKAARLLRVRCRTPPPSLHSLLPPPLPVDPVAACRLCIGLRCGILKRVARVPQGTSG
jgi:hypothetical protein